MPSTYTPITTTTLGSATNTVTFSSISGSYTDLVCIMNLGVTTDGYAPRIRFNSDTGSNYSDTIVSGNGSAASSERHSSATSIVGSSTGYNSNSLSNTFIFSVNNYANTTTYKTAIGRSSSSTNEAAAFVGLWRSTAAINSITIFIGAGNFMANSTFTLYGIKAA